MLTQCKVSMHLFLSDSEVATMQTKKILEGFKKKDHFYHII